MPTLPWWAWLIAGVVLLGLAGGAVVYVLTDSEEALMANLQPDFADKVRAFLAAADAAGTPCYVYQTLRSLAEEATHIADGTSTLANPSNSLHTPQDPDGLARAADVWPKGILFVDDSTASAILRGLEDQMRAAGLRNIDPQVTGGKFSDLGHLQDL